MFLIVNSTIDQQKRKGLEKSESGIHFQIAQRNLNFFFDFWSSFLKMPIINWCRNSKDSKIIYFFPKNSTDGILQKKNQVFFSVGLSVGYV